MYKISSGTAALVSIGYIVIIKISTRHVNLGIALKIKHIRTIRIAHNRHERISVSSNRIQFYRRSAKAGNYVKIKLMAMSSTIVAAGKTASGYMKIAVVQCDNYGRIVIYAVAGRIERSRGIYANKMPRTANAAYARTVAFGIDYGRRTAHVHGSFEVALNYHREILSAIEEGDAEAARDCTRRHILQALADINKSGKGEPQQ